MVLTATATLFPVGERDQPIVEIGKFSLDIHGNEVKGQRVLVRLSGNLTTLESEGLLSAMNLLVSCEPAEIIFDLDELRYVNDVFAGALSVLRQELHRQNAQLGLIRVTGRVAQSVKLMKFVRLVDRVYESREALVDAVVPSRAS